MFSALLIAAVAAILGFLFDRNQKRQTNARGKQSGRHPDSKMQMAFMIVVVAGALLLIVPLVWHR